MESFGMAPYGKKAPRVLLLSAHTDDCEFGMGATVSRLTKSGAEVHLLVFCNAWQSLPEGYAQDTLIKEQYQAAEVLGIPKENVQFEDIPVRHFPAHRQEILDRLIVAKRQIRPDIVFCPSLQDNHQDHNTLARESQRAFKDVTLIGFIFPWNVQTEIRHLFIEVTDQDVESKLSAIACYKSQASKNYGDPEVQTMNTKFGGLVISKKNAEIFEIIRMVIPVANS
jgi:N-acetylglucosamine malate deacetylase 1